MRLLKRRKLLKLLKKSRRRIYAYKKRGSYGSIGNQKSDRAAVRG